MSARLLLEVALRILGVWFIVTAMNTLATTASFYFSSGFSGNADFTTWLYVSGISVLTYFLIGLGLILCAPPVALRLYPEQGDVRKPQARIGPGDIYHIACFMMGVFVFIKAVEPAGRIANASFRGPQFGTAGDVLTMIVYISAGIFLVFGARRIGELLSSMRHAPDSISNHQFSIKVLLILTGIVAVLLGVARWLSQ